MVDGTRLEALRSGSFQVYLASPSREAPAIATETYSRRLRRARRWPQPQSSSHQIVFGLRSMEPTYTFCYHIAAW